MKKNKLWFGILILFNISVGAVVLFYQLKEPKVAYVQLGKLYNEFKMKAELQGKLETVANARNLVLDSIELHLKALSSQLSGPYFKGKEREEKIRQFEMTRQEYVVKKKNFTEDTERASAQYDEQIWKQLNQYVTDYGKEKGFKAILGADGNGGLMYAQEELDITKEVCAYVNTKYKGGR